MKGGFGLSFAK